MSKLFELFGVTIKKGEYLFKEGDKADYMYMIQKGTVEVNKASGETIRKFKELGENEFVGEMAIINSAPRSANAVALEDCELIRMDKESFENTIRNNHQFAITIIRFLSERLRETDQSLAEAMAALSGKKC